MKILEVQHVVKTYGSHQNQVTALSDVSFAAEQGEFIAIVGTSGSGKSTHCRASEGRIRGVLV